jgi:hypothetical protein
MKSTDIEVPSDTNHRSRRTSCAVCTGAGAKRRTARGACLLLVALAAALGATSAAAQEEKDWAKKMFSETSYNFGTVARGAKVEHRFVVENIYEEDMRIESVSSSCGCTSPQVAKPLLKTFEKTEVVVTIDTRGHIGRKDATIEVVFALPFYARVQLHTYAYIRGDIVVQPGEVQFGSVAQGAGASRDLKISYAGRNDWQIVRVECANPSIVAQAVETYRGSGQVGYRLAVKLKPDAPAGYLRDPLVLVTNDANPRTARVPVSVEGLVAAALVARPSPLLMGSVEVGKTVTGRLAVQGRKPFHVLAVRSSDPRFQCTLPTDARLLHLLPVTFSADGANSAPGKVTAKLRIETDMPDAGTVEVDASAQVTGGKETKP